MMLESLMDEETGDLQQKQQHLTVPCIPGRDWQAMTWRPRGEILAKIIFESVIVMKFACLGSWAASEGGDSFVGCHGKGGSY